METKRYSRRRELVNRRTLFVTCLIALAVGLFSGCKDHLAKSQGVPDNENPPETLVAAPGLLEPMSEEVKVGAELNGKIQAVFVEEGDRIQRGQPIATIEDAEYRARLASADKWSAQRRTRDRKVAARRDSSRAAQRPDRVAAPPAALQRRRHLQGGSRSGRPGLQRSYRTL